jgi:hypothetical protein
MHLFVLQFTGKQQQQELGVIVQEGVLEIRPLGWALILFFSGGGFAVLP